MKRSAPEFRLKSCEAALQEVHTRMPFHYGAAKLTAAPTLLVRVEIETTAGTVGQGLAADCLPPRWFDKEPGKDYRGEVEDQLEAFRYAREIWQLLGAEPRTAYGLWEEALPRVIDGVTPRGINSLTASFGSSFLERAVIDALCRIEGCSLADALRRDLLGFDTSSIVPKAPRRLVWCRHTVGLGDPITRGEIPDGERLEDGLPQALEEDIEFYGLRYFKVKLRGDLEPDLERLTRIAALISQRCHSGFAITLDGNEQYRDAARIENLLEELRRRPYGDDFFDAILFIEQPLERSIALEERGATAIRRLSELKPVIIDESDDRLTAFETAVELGYRGVSHKNCKGIFKSLKNRGLINRLNKEAGEPLYVQSAEDLANLAVVPLQEDLASVASLGIEHVERNGHHYYRGLDHLPEDEARSALAAHPDLYEESEGSVFLRIVDGALQLGTTVDAVGYGFAGEIDFDARTPIDAWSFDGLEEAIERDEKCSDD